MNVQIKFRDFSTKTLMDVRQIAPSFGLGEVYFTQHPYDPAKETIHRYDVDEIASIEVLP